MTEDHRPPGFTMSPRQLTWVLILITAGFFAFGLVMMRRVPPRPKPLLNALLEIRMADWVPPEDVSSAKRLYPSVVVVNQSTDSWNNVVVTLDKQFYFYANKPLGPQQSLTVPLEHFVTKGGNVTFRPSSQSVEKLILFAQIPNGDRGLLEQAVRYP